MADTNDTLHALIRLIPPTRALEEDLEKSIHVRYRPVKRAACP